jgi:hypothetical protein
MAIPTYFRSDGFVKSAIGPAVPGAQVFLCQQPANLPTSLTATVPTPTPLQSIYSDPNGLVPITQPILTDGFGHYDFYVLPGTYTLAVYLSGVLQQQYADQTIGIASGGNSFIAGQGITIVNNTISTTRTAAIQYVIDGGGSVPSTGAKGQVSIPTACTVTGWVLTADVSGSAVVDVLRSTYAGFPTTSSIAGSDKPTLSSVQNNSNLAVSAWTTAINAGDEIQFNLNSVTTCTRLNLTINVTIP